ncbi:MAG: TIGR03757 family integrating conjugative element protein [Gammaproteobacteria bacterium]|nr:TIGR03757 family integrating conjugative element protein [Gammaproteobacteria bacterium]
MPKKWCWILLLVADVCVADSDINSIDIFYDQASQIRTRGDLGFPIRFHNLDSIKEMKLDLVTDLPRGVSKEEIVTVLKQRIAVKESEGAFNSFFTPMLTAHKYNITKVPAMLINEQYIIYGVEDVTDAMRIWNRTKSRYLE